MRDRIAALKEAARAGFEAAVRRADPGRALTRCLAQHPLPAPGPGGRYLVVAVGKAAPAMTRALLPQLTGTVEAICVTQAGNTEKAGTARVFRAGHPVPDQTGAEAAQAVIELLEGAGPEDRVIALISGGGSALLPAPPPGVTLADKQTLNAALLASGLDIVAMNLVRQQVSQLKGGGFLRLASPATVTAFILSDVVGDDLRAIASGPTTAPLGTRAEARRDVREAGLWDQLPAAIRRHLGAGDETIPLPPARNHLIGGNAQSVEAAAQSLARDFPVIADALPLTGDVTAAAARIFSALQQHRGHEGPLALVWGGETTVRLTGHGLGGRNQELALRVAALADARPLARPWVFLSGGTDGRDGPTEAAGAITDQNSLPRLRRLGADPEALLANNDSHRALALSRDLLMTGATGTNVADVQILLLG
ncbi:glycerate kinase type-2 family protein [Pararhodobacter sp.]|uniref:glycerate kinase type-2 family protein n=1 Tax=Pararhodobacter sp. TaxID=2127056 RepID=UPI002FDF7824